MEWKKLHTKTFRSPFFLNNPFWYKGAWACMIAEADEHGRCTADARQLQRLFSPGQGRPRTGEWQVLVNRLTDARMISVVEENGVKYANLTKWEIYQKRNKICSSERKRDEKERGKDGNPPFESFEKKRMQEKLADTMELVRKRKNGNGVVH